MSEGYSKALIKIAQKAATKLKIALKQGVYAGVLGPNYETPAEIQMLKKLGADAVGMSTVLETLAARHLGVDVLGISCLTNKAAGLSKTPLSHEEVSEAGKAAGEKFGLLLTTLLPELAKRYENV